LWHTESVYELDLMCAEPLARIPDIVEIEEGVIGIGMCILLLKYVCSRYLSILETEVADSNPSC